MGIGSTGDFSVENIIQDKPAPREVISTFGYSFGAEDGWSEEMQTIGFFGPRMNVQPKFYAPSLKKAISVNKEEQSKAAAAASSIARKIPKFGRFGDVAHPLSGFEGGQMGFDFSAMLNDAKKAVSAAVDTAVSQAKTQLNTQVQKSTADAGKALQTQVTAAQQTLQKNVAGVAGQINKAVGQTQQAVAQVQSTIKTAADTAAKVADTSKSIQTNVLDKAASIKAMFESPANKQKMMIMAAAGVGLVAAYIIYKKKKASRGLIAA